MKKILLISMWVLAGAAMCFGATNYVVPPGTTGVTPTPPYTNGWDYAATNLIEAVNAAGVSNTVLVSTGLYLLTNYVDITKSLHVKSWNRELGRVDRAGTIVNGNYPATTNRCFRLYGVSAKIILEGFTITNGFASGATTVGSGGGIYFGATAESMITNCVIAGCEAAYAGGGIACMIFYCAIGNSEVVGNAAGAYGGGIYCHDNPGDRLINGVLISNNTASLDGGGIYVGSSPVGIITNCVIVNNATLGQGGGVYVHRVARISDSVISGNSATNSGYGGGLYFYFGGATGLVAVEHCVISANRNAREGGGIYLRSTATNVTMRNCLIAQNTNSLGGNYHGGGVMMLHAANLVENCTIAGNRSAGTNCYAGGVYLNFAATAQTNLRNCIVYDNIASNYPDVHVVTTALVYNCCLKPAGAKDGIASGANNLEDAPLFAETDAGNYRLQRLSPCINAGTNQSWMAAGSDLDRRARLDRVCGIADIGCYEYIPAITFFSLK